MSIKINLLPFFRQYTNGQEVVEVKGNTVGQCVTDLVKQFPDIKPVLFSDDGKLRRHIDIYVNGESSHPEGLDKPVEPSEEIHIFFIIEGGWATTGRGGKN